MQTPFSCSRHPVAGNALAFTLLEVLVAVSVVAAIAGSSILGLVQLNHNAMVARLQTGASTIAQAKIERFLAIGPFRPDLGVSAAELAVGMTSEGTADAPSVPIYRDASDPTTRVNGWTVTRISDVSSTYLGEKLWAYQCEVTVAYRYRDKNFRVRMSTVRTAD
jgi:prepilin-type N-terminal cleavage/methylation domain-containing protein